MPKGFFPPSGGNMQQLLKQAQKMQQDIARIQAELEEKEVTAASGGGIVTVTVTGKKKIKSIVIKPEAVDPDDVEMLQDLVLAAVNEAMAQAEEMASQEMAKATGGMGMPGMF
jgi:DNA-binding YbaB/EbfC family protein